MDSLTIRDKVKWAAAESHLAWTKLAFRWTDKQELLIPPHFRVMASVFDDVLAGRRKRVLINIPPRHGKSECGVKSLSSRIFALNPTARIMHTSYSDGLVEKNSRNIKAVLESPQFGMCFPETQLAKDSFAKKHWNTTGGGEFHAVSTASAVTGFECGKSGHPLDGGLIIDDPEKASGMSSAPYRSLIKDVVGQTAATRLNHDDTWIVAIQQRTHVDDVSNWLMSGGTGDVWDVLCLPAINEDGKPPAHYYDYSHANVIDYNLTPGALWEERKPLASLHRIRDAQEDIDSEEPRGKRVFAAQYQQNPADVTISLFEEGWLKRYSNADFPWSVTRISMRLDTAQKGSKGSDYNGLVILGHDERDPNTIYVIDADRKRDEFPAIVDWLVATIQRLWLLQTNSIHLTSLTIEDANIGAALMTVLQVRLNALGIHIGLSLTPKYGNKFARAMEAVPYLQQGRVFLPIDRNRFMHDRRTVDNETELEGVKVLLDEYRTFNETDTHASDDILDPLIWEVVSKWGGAKGSSRFW